jgi:hypothetical protein
MAVEATQFATVEDAVRDRPHSQRQWRGSQWDLADDGWWGRDDGGESTGGRRPLDYAHGAARLRRPHRPDERLADDQRSREVAQTPPGRNLSTKAFTSTISRFPRGT